MIWQFGELGYDQSINRCVNGTIGDCRLDRKPIRWYYQDDEGRRDLYNVYREMIQLKIEDDIFETDNYVLNLSGEVKTIQLLSDDGNAVLIGNFGVAKKQISLSFPSDGIWFEYFGGASLFLDDINYQATLAPGEYRLYFDEEKSVISNIPSLEELGFKINTYPNPASELLNIEIFTDVSINLNAEILDYRGQTIRELEPMQVINGKLQRRVDVSDLNSGLYYLRLGNELGVSLSVLSVIRS